MKNIPTSLIALFGSSLLASAAEKPNIIFLLTDDQRDNTLGGWGIPF